MSDSKQRFIELVHGLFDTFLAEFGLLPVESDWPDTVRYSSNLLTLDFYYGPPEYRVEVFFIRSQTSPARTYSLADLFKKEEIKQWVYENKLTEESEDKVKQGLAWHYRLLRECCVDALKGDEAFFAGM